MRLKRDFGLQGVIRGKTVRTIVGDKAAALCPVDEVNPQFEGPAPNWLRVAKFTYVVTWTGFIYVTFVIDVYARYIVGWRNSRTAHANFVFDALEQALHDRHLVHRSDLVHHSDRGAQYISIKYTERQAKAGRTVSAIPATTPSPRSLTASTKLSLFTGADYGDRLRQ